MNPLLNMIMKALGKETTAASVETLQVGVTEAEVQALVDSAVTELKADFGTKLEDAQALVASLTAELEAAKAELTSAADAQAAAEAAALKAKLDARREKIVAAIGEDKADAFMSATEQLDDAAFAAVSSALSGNLEAEAAGALFNEVGVDTTTTSKQADAGAAPEKTTLELLREKHGAK